MRGSGRWGYVGEGTHTGVSGDGFIGVRGATSIFQGEEGGVGIWARAMTSGCTVLRADGTSEFNGITTFSTSGAVTVQRGVTGLFLHAVETDVAEGTFTIFLNAAPDREVRIGVSSLHVEAQVALARTLPTWFASST